MNELEPRESAQTGASNRVKATGKRIARYLGGRPEHPARVGHGPSRGVLRTLALSVGVLLIAVGLFTVGTTFFVSLNRHLEHSRIAHPDGTVARVLNAVSVPQRDLGLVYRDMDGTVRRVLVERDAADRFVNAALQRLEDQRAQALKRASEDVTRIFATAFADRDAAIEAYADWFFAWKRSYVLLSEAMASTATRLVEVGEVEPLHIAVSRDLKDYFLRHYTEQVLKPALRDSVISAGFESAARDAHDRYLAAIAEGDLRVQLFLSREGRMVSTQNQDAVTALDLDWDSQRFNAPTYLMEDRAFDAVTGVGTVVTAGTLGAFVLRPALGRAGARAFSMLGRRAATAMTARVALGTGGAAAGSAVPGGAVGGAIVGGLVGLAIDYAVNEAGEALNREGFIEANQDALNATTDVWQRRLELALHEAVNTWFDDAREAIVVERVTVR
ncbi:MAG: hypothetical protein AAGD23_08395 [Pseudomonadota bacterium]